MHWNRTYNFMVEFHLKGLACIINVCKCIKNVCECIIKAVHRPNIGSCRKGPVLKNLHNRFLKKNMENNLAKNIWLDGLVTTCVKPLFLLLPPTSWLHELHDFAFVFFSWQISKFQIWNTAAGDLHLNPWLSELDFIAIIFTNTVRIKHECSNVKDEWWNAEKKVRKWENLGIWSWIRSRSKFRSSLISLITPTRVPLTVCQQIPVKFSFFKVFTSMPNSLYSFLRIPVKFSFFKVFTSMPNALYSFLKIPAKFSLQVFSSMSRSCFL